MVAKVNKPPLTVPAALAAAGLQQQGSAVPAVTMTEFTLTIPLERLNSIVACMGAGPFNLVQDHINWIQTQCQAQVAAAQKLANEAAQTAKA